MHLPNERRRNCRIVILANWYEYTGKLTSIRFDAMRMVVVKSLPMRTIVCALVALAGSLVWAETFERIESGFSVGPVKIWCGDSSTWSFASTRTACADGTEELKIVLSSPQEALPPTFYVAWSMPQRDLHHRWSARTTDVGMPPVWAGEVMSDLARGIPVYALFNDVETNRFTFATDESHQQVRFNACVQEEGCIVRCSFGYFTGTKSPMTAYEVRIRFDARAVFWADAVREAAEWVSSRPGNDPCATPDAAFKPLYSTWYGFHQNLFASEIERECEIAAKLGMKTLIVDDGWQTDDTNRGYAYCGDWNVSTRRFPDMAAHVRKVQEMGLKYMVWYSVPFIGEKSTNYEKFKGKYLYNTMGAGVLDPRFPEVRAFLVGIYEKALRDWNLDGFKLDFIDSIAVQGRDPAIAENYAGRDYRNLAEATDRLMADVMARLKSIKPDLLVEFRQQYIGAAIRKYGNMMRVADCPGDKQANRCGIAQLRLTSGKSAVHGDMLEWHPSDTVERAARPVLDSLFGVVQYSMVLTNLPAAHVEMIRHWSDFSTRHEEALLHGAFRPHHPEARYPVLEGESAAERIVGVYLNDAVVDCGAADKPVYVVNGSGASRLTLRLAAMPQAVAAFDVLGKSVPPPALREGVQDVVVPVSGYLRIEW